MRPVDEVDDIVAEAMVETRSERFSITAHATLTVGRADQRGVVGLDDSDTGISRLAARIRPEGRFLVVDNLSTKRHVVVEHDGVVSHSHVAPETSEVLP